MTQFWIYNPNTLLEKENLTKVWPSQEENYESNLNALTRLVLIITMVGLLLHNNTRTLIVGILSLLLIVLMYFVRKYRIENFSNDDTIKPFQEEKSYTDIKVDNPLSNVLLNEIHDTPDRGSAKPAYCESVHKEINETTKQMIKQMNPTHTNIEKKLFRDLGDEYEFDTSMRQFFSTANTEVVNDQEGFAKFCYGNLPSRKEDNIMNY